MARPRLPDWSWAYVTFRIGDGLTNLLVPLAVYKHYHGELWVLAVVAAAMNLVSVPATFLWGAIVERTPYRRQVVTLGFLLAGAALALLSALPPFWLFVAAAMAYTGFGVATAPAASTLVLHGVNRSEWANATSRLSRRTGLAYLTGLSLAVLAGYLLGDVDFRAIFAAAAVLCLGACALAAWKVPHYQPPLPHEPDYDPRVAQAGQRVFERSVYFPGRMRYRPTWSSVRASLLKGHRLWPLGFTLTFAGSVCFFASYPGILAGHLHLADGLVILSQAPSNLVSPLVYPLSARFGQRAGEAAGVLRGSLIRMATIPIMAFLIVVLAGPFPAAVVVPLMVLHGLMGLSFALIQVNGAILMARSHPKGRGQGVGTYHAAVGLGTLLGSTTAFLVLRSHPFWWSYAVAIVVSLAGGATLLAAGRVERRRDAARLLG